MPRKVCPTEADCPYNFWRSSTDINTSWEEDRQAEMKELAGKGLIPAIKIWKELEAADIANPDTPTDGNEQARVQLRIRPRIMGQAAGGITQVLTAKRIIEEMVAGAVARIDALAALRAHL